MRKSRFSEAQIIGMIKRIGSRDAYGGGVTPLVHVNMHCRAVHGKTDTAKASTPGSGVIPPFLMGLSHRIHAAVFSFIAGVMPPMPMLGRSLL